MIKVAGLDESAAYNYGKIMSYRKKLGRPISIPNGQTAAIATTHNAVVATRNVRDFTNSGLQLINPFNSI